jgi:hypothetical protein
MLFPRLLSPALLWLVVAGPGIAESPPTTAKAPPRSANQHLADCVAQQLQTSGRLHGYSIDVTCTEGVVQLEGSVASAAQRDEAEEVARTVAGVGSVHNWLAIREPSGSSGQVILAQVRAEPLDVAPAPRRIEDSFVPAEVIPTEPVPSFQAPSAQAAYSLPPFMPPYAWPTYAPYNNYSRVAYPISYPYQAFPFIGPVYPFPKVPPGWRSVKLEWNDGHWWLSTHGQKRDWWILRYW